MNYSTISLTGTAEGLLQDAGNKLTYGEAT